MESLVGGRYLGLDTYPREFSIREYAWIGILWLGKFVWVRLELLKVYIIIIIIMGNHLSTSMNIRVHIYIQIVINDDDDDE